MTRPGGDPRQRVGLAGERAAEAALQRAGLTPIERRFRRRFGEIDLIARRGPLIVFVEVKTRRGDRFGRPAEAVTPAKQRRMARVAASYLQRRGWLEQPCRFDVVEVTLQPGAAPRVRHIEDAFRLTPTG